MSEKTLEKLVVKISADISELKEALVTVEKSSKDSMGKVSKQSKIVKASISRLKTGFYALAAAMGAAQVYSAKLAGGFEQSRLSFEIMLGSLAKGDKLLKEIIQFTKSTPFELKDTELGAKRLLAYNIEADKVIKTLEVLGNIASVVGRERLPNLILAYGQVKTATRLAGQELRQFSEAGVPLIDALSVQLSVSRAQIKGMVEEGRIGFSDVEKALLNLSTGSGRFADLMKRQSKTFLGTLSNIKDNISIISIGIGNKMLPMLKKVAEKIKEISDNFANIEFAREDQLVKDIRSTEIKIDGLNKAIKRLSDEGNKNKADKLNKAIHTLGQSIKASFTALNGGRPATEKYKTSTERLTEALDNQKETLKKLKAELKELRSGYSNSTEETQTQPLQGPLIGKTKEEIEDLRRAFFSVFTTITTVINESTDEWSTNLADAILDAKSDLNSLKDFMNSVFRDISRAVIKQQITDPLIESVSSVATDFINPKKGSVSTQSFNGAQSGVSSNGVTIQQSFNISSGAEINTIDQKIAQAAPVIAEQAQQGVFNAINRGGSASRMSGRR